MLGSIRLPHAIALLLPWLLVSSGVVAQGLVHSPGVDYFGADLRTLESVPLDGCERACADDPDCLAFTYDQRSGWCFLKSAPGEARAAPGARSGYRPELLWDDPGALPETLAFIPPDARALAREQARALALEAPPGQGLATLARAAPGETSAQRRARLRALLRLAPADAAAWRALAETALVAAANDWRARDEALAAALAAARLAPEDGATLALLGRAFAARESWPEAIRATRAALALHEDATLRAEYARLLAEHGFRVLDHAIDADAAAPRVCVRFSEPLARDRAEIDDFVRVEGDPDLALQPERDQLCLDGVRHGQGYRVRLRAGLPSATGEVLARDVELDLYVRDRAPLARFQSRAYVLPRGSGARLPVVSVNSARLALELYRVDDRALTQVRAEGLFERQLDRWSRERIAERLGSALWSGSVAVDARRNQEVSTGIPLDALVERFEPGVYLLTARPQELSAERDESLASQWFVVSDLGLSALTGADGLHVLVRALGTAEPRAGVRLRLLAVNDRVLGETRSDAAGYARFAPGLLRGRGGDAPALLVAEAEEAAGDYAFLDLARAPFDLRDRGVAGRPPAAALDVFLSSERGAYRPGESVVLTALVRDRLAAAVTGLTTTLVVERPDGHVARRQRLDDQGGGAYRAQVALADTAMHGTWRARLHADPEGPALAEVAFLVEDFVPERVDLVAELPPGPLDPAALPDLGLEARYRYGAPGAGLQLDGELRVVARDQLEAAPGFRFGLTDEDFTPLGAALPTRRADAAGRARMPLVLPELDPSTRPLALTLQVRASEDGARPVERRLTRALRDPAPRLGARALFDDRVESGASAAFELIALDPSGERIAVEHARWTLARLETRFQWYRLDDRWRYEPIVTSRRVASGELALDAETPARLETAVDWGSYRLTVEDGAGRALPVALDFDAGWTTAPGREDTPDLLGVTLDRPGYAVGERARVRLEPRFAGTATVLVVGERLLARRQVEVPAEGLTLELPVETDWGAGAYVCVLLHRPLDTAAGRMPGRAIGLRWAAVDPGARRLGVAIEAPALARPRAPLEVTLQVAGATPEEPVHVTLAAVDTGILALTDHPTPAPNDWYFGQRRLGTEIRDLYGRLIDPFGATPGVVRSGGDGGILERRAPPPTEPLLALQSAILEVDAEGRARVRLALPQFEGRVRLAAMAWSADGVGHAARELLVRDPVSVRASLPALLAPGDRSRLGLELTAFEGVSGPARVEVTAAGPLQVPVEARGHDVMLAPGAPVALDLPLSATATGEGALRVRLVPPVGAPIERRFALEVRDQRAATLSRRWHRLAPGERWRPAADALAGLAPAGASLVLADAAMTGIDVAGPLLALDRYPYRCTEQRVSRALPLLALAERARALEAPREVAARLTETLAEVLASQRADGGFGRWGQDGGSAWLDAYVSDFLVRADAHGLAVPAQALALALDNLANQVAYAPEFSHGGESLAYALAVLARAGRADLGDLRYYLDARLEHFATPLARAQLGAALARYGEQERAARAFASAVAMTPPGDADGWREDYGSWLRDRAGVIVLAAESGVALEAPAQLLAGLDLEGALSTQELAWLARAAGVLSRGDDEGVLPLRLDPAALAAAPWIENPGEGPLTLVETRIGVPEGAVVAGGVGYRISRSYHDLDGRALDPAALVQGQQLVVVLDVESSRARRGRLLVVDPLPGGLAIANPRLLGGDAPAGFDWLGETVEWPLHQSFGRDALVVALERDEAAPRRFRLAYRARAVAPGVFALAPARIEDMYRPRLRGWGASGELRVAPPAP
ncbi:alpha-2-macroglobulin family protein [Marichromatium gracile]|uniref:Apple domain-containing protein n=3 Tax=Marichromatium TaxID=85076 RepID=A0A4R4A6S3_MARGR|nr:alpha-2-macroglobulin family protein [Marichromatium gracile]TCW34522.1 hypothetical protein EDC29_11069 [Marichromatium gracile]